LFIGNKKNIKILKPFEDIKLEYEIFGVKIQQNNYALQLIDYLLKNLNPKLIIEFGARTGGLSVFLSLYSKLKNCEFLTFEYAKENTPLLYENIIKGFDGKIHYEDIFSKNVIDLLKEKIASSERSILFCDALKIQEFNLYSDFMKSGDIILAHDYAHDEEDFQNMMNERIWFCNEIKYKDIEESCKRNNLYYLDFELFRTSAWGVFIKK
jgi:predicted O-methyltransferase YrrM